MADKTLRQLREERDHWYMIASMDTCSLSRTLEKVREVERKYQEALIAKGVRITITTRKEDK